MVVTMAEDFQKIQKKVDEDWKTQIERERAARPHEKPPPAAADFSVFLSTLSMQALVALGEIPHPQTNAQGIDLEQARYLIDLLGMLQEKTKGNLTPEEEKALEGVLYELRTKYVAKTRKGSA
jgi:hypothetical protein